LHEITILQDRYETKFTLLYIHVLTNILPDMTVIITTWYLTCFGGDDVSESKQHCRRERETLLISNADGFPVHSSFTSRGIGRLPHPSHIE